MSKRVTDNELQRLEGGQQGIANLSPETALPMGKAGRGGVVTGSLREAENLDLDNEGHPSRRPGYSQVEALPDLHSLWANKRFPFMFAVYNGNLVAFDENEARTTVTNLVSRSSKMSYDYDAGWVYYTNGFDSGRVNMDLGRQPWAIQAPIGQPLADPTAGTGGLPGGVYQVAITYLDVDGRESGSTLATEVEIADGEGIALTSIPQPSDASVTAVRVYASKANGEELRYVRDLAVGMTSATIAVHQPGKVLATQFQEAMPPGQIIRLYKGYMLVARGKVLYVSGAEHYGQAVLHNSYVSFNEDISLLEGVHVDGSPGLYLAAGKRTYYLAGDTPDQWRRAIAHPHGAVPGSSVLVDATVLGLEVAGDIPFWLGDDGQFVIGTPAGRVQPLHAERYAAPSEVESAAVMFREAGGLRHLIATLQGGVSNSLAVGDRAEAEVWRDGVRIS